MRKKTDQDQEYQATNNHVVQSKSQKSSKGAFLDNSTRRQKATQLQAVANNHAQKKGATLVDNRQTTTAQFKNISQEQPVEEQTKTPNKTGLPDNLKSGIENLSGYSMDDVKVHRNSSKPAQLQAHAYAQGTDIHLAPGQEKHLPHEAWHVAQQKQGRVQPTTQMKEKVNINDDAGLEKEADVMGAKALKATNTTTSLQMKSIDSPLVQAKLVKGKLNVVGEDHKESGKRRGTEAKMLSEKIGVDSGHLWLENEFLTGDPQHVADPFELRVLQSLDFLNTVVSDEARGKVARDCFQGLLVTLKALKDNKKEAILTKKRKKFYKALELKVRKWIRKSISYLDYNDRAGLIALKEILAKEFPKIRENIATAIGSTTNDLNEQDKIGAARSQAMHDAANMEAATQKGVWKIGEQHVQDILPLEEKQYELTPKDEFNRMLDEYKNQ